MLLQALRTHSRGDSGRPPRRTCNGAFYPCSRGHRARRLHAARPQHASPRQPWTPASSRSGNRGPRSSIPRHGHTSRATSSTDPCRILYPTPTPLENPDRTGRQSECQTTPMSALSIGPFLHNGVQTEQRRRASRKPCPRAGAAWTPASLSVASTFPYRASGAECGCGCAAGLPSAARLRASRCLSDATQSPVV